jgi:hypothetical protein
MVQTDDVIMLVLVAALAVLVVLAIVSLMLQMSATQTYELTQELFPALDAAGYEYWMDWGTLLGAQREQTMIPHDYDADIGMRESEFQRLKATWSEQPKFAGMRLSKEKDGLYKVRRGLGWVDVFRYDDSSPDTLPMLSLSSFEHSCKCPGTGHTVSASTLFPLISLPFGRVSARAPARTVEYLTHLYGPTWTVPRVDGKSKLLVLMPMRSQRAVRGR